MQMMEIFTYEDEEALGVPWIHFIHQLQQLCGNVDEVSVLWWYLLKGVEF